MTTTDRRFWNTIAPDFENEIFDVIKEDRRHVVREQIARHASNNRSACDFGCGVGRALPLLSKCFGSVYAIDFSPTCLSLAQQGNGRFTNISYLCANLAENSLSMEPVHFGICVNVLVMTDEEVRQSILQSIYRHIRKRGYLLLVVPSLESVLYARFVLKEISKRKKRRSGAWSAVSWDARSCRQLMDGIVNRSGFTKHFLKEELEFVLPKVGFTVHLLDRVEYRWSAEFFGGQTRIRGSFPWDWLVVCGRF